MSPSELCSQDTPIYYLHFVWERQFHARAKLSKYSNTHPFLPHALFAPWLLKYLSFLLRPVLLIKLSAVLEITELFLCGVAVREHKQQYEIARQVSSVLELMWRCNQLLSGELRCLHSTQPLNMNYFFTRRIIYTVLVGFFKLKYKLYSLKESNREFLLLKNVKYLENSNQKSQKKKISLKLAYTWD